MSRRELFSTSNNGIAQNNRTAEYAGYADSSQGVSSIPIHSDLIPFTASQRGYYQGQLEFADVSQTDFRSGQSKASRFNNSPRQQFPNSHQVYQNQPRPSEHPTWQRNQLQMPPQTGHGRSPSNARTGNGYVQNLTTPPQPQFQPPPSQNHQPWRPNQSPNQRPQVRLPATNPSTPPRRNPRSIPRDDTNITPPSRNPEVRTRANTHSKEYNTKSIQNSIRRHKHSNSNSSKASTGSNPWSNFTPTKTSTQHSSPEISTQPTTSPDLKPLPMDNLGTDDEWLLLRKQTLETPKVEIERDKYGHLHPLVRKYASITHPEMKPTEPRWANAVLSRQWEQEEKLEDKRKELRERKEKGIPPSPPLQTCLTKEQYEADLFAQQTWSLLQEYDDRLNSVDMDKMEKDGKANDIEDTNKVE
jgi:hypothetical protein